MRTQQIEETLAWLTRQTHYRTVHPRMLCSPAQGSFLTSLVAWMRPSRILEIGTFTGYSAICLAYGLERAGLGPEARVDTIDIFDEHQELIDEAFTRSGLQERLQWHCGSALEVVPQLAAKGLWYPLVYIDGDKREYCAYYRLVRKLVPPGGLILADNVLWSGKIYQEKARDPQTEGIRAFNKLVKEDPTVEQVLLPVEDGLMLLKVL